MTVKGIKYALQNLSNCISSDTIKCDTCILADCVNCNVVNCLALKKAILALNKLDENIDIK